jgi:hypothetical protein
MYRRLAIVLLRVCAPEVKKKFRKRAIKNDADKKNILCKILPASSGACHVELKTFIESQLARRFEQNRLQSVGFDFAWAKTNRLKPVLLNYGVALR